MPSDLSYAEVKVWMEEPSIKTVRKLVDGAYKTVARYIPTTTAYRTVTVPASSKKVYTTLPGYTAYRKQYIPTKTEQIRIKTGSTYRYVTKTTPVDMVEEVVEAPTKIFSL